MVPEIAAESRPQRGGVRVTAYRIADEFAEDLGGRFRDDGDFSGEEFRENVLRPQMAAAIAADRVFVINFDGVTGMPTSFLEEAFGGLIRKGYWPVETVERYLRIEAPQSPKLWGFIKFAEDAMKRAGRGR